jgi:pyruvate-formate lyase-activating enzyme
VCTHTISPASLHYNASVQHEASLIGAFVKRNKRERYQEMLSDPRQRIWEMVRILERNGIYVQKVITDRPGYVVYEDEWQLVAEPFREGTLPRK